MRYLNLIKYPLLPILIPQGLWAKIRTPRLSEAQGERQGVIGTGQPIKLLILGDSAAAGVGVDHQQQALIGKICDRFELSNYNLNWQLHAKNGNTLTDLKEIAASMPTQDFDIVIISSGVNDILKQYSVHQWKQNCDDLYHLIQKKFNRPSVLFTQVPPLQHFSALPKVLAWYLGKWATEFDINVAALSQQHANLHHVKMQLANQKEYLAVDGFHPSELSYNIWANAMVDYMEVENLI